MHKNIYDKTTLKLHETLHFKIIKTVSPTYNIHAKQKQLGPVKKGAAKSRP